MDVNFINPVLKSTVEVLSTMAQLNPKPGKATKKEQYEVVPGKNVTGIISMVGSQAEASVAITLSEPVAIFIANKMLPGEVTAIDGMVIDLVGELANMVLGGAKRYLEEDGFRFDMALPTVIYGSDYLVAHKTRAPIISLPFSSEGGVFIVEASYQPV